MASSQEQREAPKPLHLPQELCDIIKQHLNRPRDGVVLRLVCRSFAQGFWRSVIDTWRDNTSTPDLAFHEREFRLVIDGYGIRDIEALAQSPFADQVRQITFMDRFPISVYLEQTEQHVRDEWLEAPHKKFLDDGSPALEVHQFSVPMQTGRKDVMVRSVVGDYTCPDTTKFLPRLQFHNLLPDDCLTRADDFVYDYTVKGVDRRTVWYAEFAATPETIVRLGSALPKLINLRSVRTLRGDAVIVGAPKDIRAIWDRPWKEAEWNNKKSCLTSTHVSPYKQDYRVVGFPASRDLGKIMYHVPDDNTPELMITKLELAIYRNELYHDFHVLRDAASLVDFITSCTLLEDLALVEGEHSGIDRNMREILKWLAAGSTINSLKRIFMHEVDPTDPNLVTFLCRHAETLEEVSIAWGIHSQNCAGWITFFETTMSMPKLTNLVVDVYVCSSRPMHLPFPLCTCVSCLWPQHANLATAEVLLPIMEQLRMYIAQEQIARILFPVDVWCGERLPKQLWNGTRGWHGMSEESQNKFGFPHA